MCNSGAGGNTPYTHEESNYLQEEVRKDFKSAQDKIIDFFKGNYVNWNPCYTHDGQLTDTFENPDLSTISLSSIIDDALTQSDFTYLDRIYCEIIQTSCRHIVHRGKDGKPHSKDYCYERKEIVDKKLSTKDKKKYKTVEVCKRRKPQPKRAKPAIYTDPHDKKYTQLSFACNDEWFNGADPFIYCHRQC